MAAQTHARKELPYVLNSEGICYMKTSVRLVTFIALVSLGNLAAWFLYTPSHPDSAAIFVFPLLFGMGLLSQYSRHYSSSFLLQESFIACVLGFVVSAVSFVAWFFREDSSAATLVLVAAVFFLIFNLAHLIAFLFRPFLFFRQEVSRYLPLDVDDSTGRFGTWIPGDDEDDWR